MKLVTKEGAVKAGGALTAAALVSALVWATSHDSENPKKHTPAARIEKAGCGALKSFNMIGTGPNGLNAANTGACAAVYNPDSLRTVGTIPDGQKGAFVIKCSQVKPTSFEVIAGETVGRVNLDDAALRQFNQNRFSEIPEC